MIKGGGTRERMNWEDGYKSERNNRYKLHKLLLFPGRNSGISGVENGKLIGERRRFAAEW